MSAQPANTEIEISRTVRAQRADHRHDTVEVLTKKLRPLFMSIPGAEVISGVLFRDTNLSDTSSYMGEARHGATRGFPIVIGLKDTVAFGEAQEDLAGVDFAITIGRDKFLSNSADGLTNDLHADLRALQN